MTKQTIRYWTLPILLGMTCLGACSKQTAEEKGKELATEKIDLVKGIGTAMEEKGSAAGESVAAGVGNVVNGIAKGFEKSTTNISNTPATTGAGITVSQVQRSKTGQHAFDIYITASKAVSGDLIMLGFDRLDKEASRTKIKIKFDANDARYETIELDSRVDLESLHKFTFDFASATSGEQAQKK